MCENNCTTCKNYVPKEEFKVGDIIQTNYGRKIIIQDTRTSQKDNSYGTIGENGRIGLCGYSTIEGLISFYRMSDSNGVKSTVYKTGTLRDIL